jgi:hypothetical protein
MNVFFLVKTVDVKPPSPFQKCLQGNVGLNLAQPVWQAPKTEIRERMTSLKNCNWCRFPGSSVIRLVMFTDISDETGNATLRWIRAKSVVVERQ